MSFFDLSSKQFFGSSKGHICSEPIFWYSKNNDSKHILVLEFIAIQSCARTGIEETKQRCGWTFLGMLEIECNTDLSFPVYQGTPRKLLYIGNGASYSELIKLLPSTDAAVQLTIENKVFDTPPLVHDNFIFDAKLFADNDVESIQMQVIHISNLAISFERISREEVDKCAIAACNGGSLTKQKNTFLQFSKSRRDKKAKQETRVVQRSIHFTIHNGHVPLSNTTVDLDTDESGGLNVEKEIVVENYFKHELCVLLASLEFTVYIPSPNSHKKGTFHKVLLGHLFVIDRDMDTSHFCQPLGRHDCLSALFPSMSMQQPNNIPGDILLRFDLSLSNKNGDKSEERPVSVSDQSGRSKASHGDQIGSEASTTSLEELEEITDEESKLQSEVSDKEFDSVHNVLLESTDVHLEVLNNNSILGESNDDISQEPVVRKDVDDGCIDESMSLSVGKPRVITPTLLQDHVVRCEIELTIASIAIESHHDPVYSCYQFYKNRECRTEKLEECSVHRQFTSCIFDEWGKERKDLLHYLQEGILNVEIWCSRSLMMIGTARIPVSACAQESFVSFSIFRQKDMYSASPDKEELCGKLQIKLRIDGNTGYTASDMKPLKEQSTIRARPMIETNAEVKVMVEEAKAALRDKSIDRSYLISFVLAMVKESNINADDMIEAVIIDWYCSQNMKSILRQHLETNADTRTVNINVTQGMTEYIELELSNCFEDDAQFLVSLNDTHMRVIVDTKEAEYARSKLCPVKLRAQEGEEFGSGNCLAQSRQVEPGLYTLWITRGTSVCIPLVHQTSHSKEDRQEINVSIRDSKNRVSYIFRFKIQILLAPVARTFHFFGKRGSPFSQNLTLPAPPPQKIHVKDLAKNLKVVESADTNHGFVIQSHFGSLNKPHELLLLLYDDVYTFTTPSCWRIVLHGYDVVSCETSAGQWSSSLIQLGPFIGNNDLTCTTNDENHVMLNPSTIKRPINGMPNDIKVSFNFKQKGTHSFIVHVVGNNEVLQGWMFEVIVK